MSLVPAVPRGWRVVPTSELLSFVTSGSRGWAQYYSDNGSPFIRIGDLQRGTLTVAWQSAQRVRPPATTEGSRTRVQPGDVLISITADLGVVGVVPDGLPEAFVNQHVALARPTNAVLPRYFGWFLDAESGGQRQFRELRRGATKAGLGLNDIRSIDVPLPPLDHQLEIVAAIETHFSRLDAAVASLTRAKANLKRARASVLKAAVEGRLVPTEAALARAEGREYEPASVLLARILAERKAAWAASGARGKYAEPLKSETNALPDLPDGWSWASVDELVQAERPVCYGVLKAGNHVDNGVPLVRVTDITSGDLSLGRLKRCSQERESTFARARLRPGDLVVSKDGTIGLAMIVPEALSGANVTQHVLRVAPNEAVLNRYMMHALHSSRAQGWMKGETRGVALQGINVGDFRLLALPLPPSAEQKRIAAEVDRRLSVLDALDASVTANLARCARLRQSILKRAFEGRLVPAEAPADAPLLAAEPSGGWSTGGAP